MYKAVILAFLLPPTAAPGTPPDTTGMEPFFEETLPGEYASLGECDFNTRWSAGGLLAALDALSGQHPLPNNVFLTMSCHDITREKVEFVMERLPFAMLNFSIGEVVASDIIGEPPVGTFIWNGNDGLQITATVEFVDSQP